MEKKYPILKSFGFAFKGLNYALKERNFRLHLASTFLVISLGLYFNINRIEWIVILFCIGLVLSMELVNTAIEEIVNFISPEHNLRAGKIKDLSAAAVLIASIFVLIIAIFIFLPYISILI